jgi:glutaredoxin 3
LAITRRSKNKVTGTPTTQQITLYSGSYCTFCIRVKRELDRLGLDYRIVNADADMRAEVIRLSGQRAIPILTIGDEVLVDSAYIIRQLRERYPEAA